LPDWTGRGCGVEDTASTSSQDDWSAHGCIRPFAPRTADPGRRERRVTEWPNATPGEHTITSRAVDTQGNVQPAMDDPRIAKKKTYWESNGQVSRQIRIA
jgi:hypothetical protein